VNIQIEKGTLAGRILPFLLRDLYLAKQTGMLSISHQSVRKFLFFEEGAITFVQSSIPDEQLGNLMLRGGVYSDEKYEQISTLVREGGWKNPKILDLNLIKQNTIDWWMRTLIREVLLSMFEWESGDYHFMFDKRPPQTCPTTSMDTLKLILACVRRIKSIDSMQMWLGSVDQVPMIDSDMMTRGFSDLNLTPQEGYFLSRIDGSLSFRQIITLAGPQKVDMLRFLVSASLTGLIRNSGMRVVFKPTEPIKPSIAPPPQSPQPPQPPQPPPPVQTTPEQKSTDENTEDVTLTEEELREIAKLGSRSLLTAPSRFAESEQKGTGAVDGSMKLEYLRDGEFIESGSQGDAAVDIEKLKLEAEDAVDALGDKITFMIDGQTVDGESNLFGQSSLKDLFSSGDVDEQWGRWMISADESDEELLKEWAESWKTWEEQSKELEEIQKKLQETQNALKGESNRERAASLAKRIEELERLSEQIISTKKKEILVAQRRAQVQSHYEVMHLSPNASMEEIREAYFKWLTEYQPDPRFVSQFESLKDAMNILCDRLHEAYEILIDPETRRRYDENLTRQKESTRVVADKKKRLAAEHLQSSQNAIKRGDTMLAMRFLRASISLDPRNSQYYQAMADIIAKNPRWWQEAMRFYHKAYHLNPDNVDVLIEVALLANRSNHPEFAEKALHQVLRARPGYPRAIKLMNEIKGQQPGL